MDPTIYDLLSKKDISEVTIELLNSATKVTAVDRKTVPFWTGPITLSQAVEKSRTYPHALPIPELSTISSNTIANAGSAQLKPSGTEIWRVEAIDSTASISVSLYDGTTNMQIHDGTDPQLFSNLFLTGTLFLVMANGSGDEATCNIAYHKVGL